MIRSALVVSSFLLGSAGLCAQEPDRQADHKALQKLREDVVAAFNSLDMNAFRSHFAPDFVFVGADQGVAASPADLQAYHAKWFQGDGALLKKIELSAKADVETRFTGADTGFVYGTADCRYHLTAGATVDIPARWTATVQRVGGAWKIVTAHMGVNVLENPVLEASVGFWKACAGAAGAVGIVLGLLLGLLFRRRRNA